MASQLALLGGEPLRKRPFTRWPLFDDRERAQLEDVLSSTAWGGHPSPNRKASELAGRFAAFQGARYAIPASSGTSALEVATKALGIGPGDEVMSPPSPLRRLPTPRSLPWHVRSSPMSILLPPASIRVVLSSSSLRAPRRSSRCTTGPRSRTSTPCPRSRAGTRSQLSRTARTFPEPNGANAEQARGGASDASAFRRANR